MNFDADSQLYKVAYDLALAGRMKKRAGVLDSIQRGSDVVFNGGKNLLALELVPTLLIAAGLGVGGGYALNRLSRHSDPSVADSNTVDDINRVERLQKIKYYNALAKQIKADKKLSKNMGWNDE